MIGYGGLRAAAPAYYDDVRRALEDGDAPALRRLWQHFQPGLPQPADDREAEATMHYARTVARSIAPRLRYYSHRWLLDRELPSGLPDELKPVAERTYPKIAVTVGIGSRRFMPYTPIVRAEVSAAVEECFADGNIEPSFLKARMTEARTAILHKLFGRWGPPAHGD